MSAECDTACEHRRFTRAPLLPDADEEQWRRVGEGGSMPPIPLPRLSVRADGLRPCSRPLTLIGCGGCGGGRGGGPAAARGGSGGPPPGPPPNYALVRHRLRAPAALRRHDQHDLARGRSIPRSLDPGADLDAAPSRRHRGGPGRGRQRRGHRSVRLVRRRSGSTTATSPTCAPQALNYQRGDLPYAGADIYRIHLATRADRSGSRFGEFTPNTGAGNCDESNPGQSAGASYNRLGYGILNLGPVPARRAARSRSPATATASCRRRASRTRRCSSS